MPLISSHFRWDKGGQNSYRMGAEGKYDLEIVGDARKQDDDRYQPILTAFVLLCFIASSRRYPAGTRVKRGKDWKWGDQDGNGLAI